VELEDLAGFILQLKGSKKDRTGPLICHSERSASGAKNLPKRPQGKLLSQVKKSLAWCYEFGDSVVLAAKQSVTELTHRDDIYTKIDYSRALDRLPTAIPADAAVLAEPVEGRLIGTATHLVISQLDLSKPVNNKAVEKTIESLLADGAITDSVSEHIDTASIVAFFESELGRQVTKEYQNVQREWPFTYALPASFVARDSSLEPRITSHQSPITDDEVVIVQGIIDMLVQTPRGIIIIDFKTDRIIASQVEQRAELYRRQLDLYGLAAGAILKDKLLGKWLYFLTPSCSVQVSENGRRERRGRNRF
jgi:ATP-dependent helicase/nuclease subunit A